MTWTRRDFLLGAAAALGGCAALHRPPVDLTAPEGPLVLGWRWVPGQQRYYGLTTERFARAGVSRRVERWRYLVQAVSGEGVATLAASLLEVDAGRAGAPPPPEALVDLRRRSAPEATLQLGMNGRLARLPTQELEASLPHRLLALRLPDHPVHLGASWPDLELGSLLASLLPQRLDPHTRSQVHLVQFDLGERGATAILRSEIAVSSDAGASLELSGESVWDANRGLLLRRTLAGRSSIGGADPSERVTATLRLL
ncbi:MAG: hypothetical protein JXX28_07145 [Deltaproteobacteria bacterium]|nr:hypothetical protein [Deltaproteobacteria bacterium]